MIWTTSRPLRRCSGPRPRPGRIRPGGRARLTVIREFARFQAAFDARTEVPPTDLFPRGADRSQPYLYSPDQIAAMLQVAARCFPSPLRAATTEAFIGLMAAIGIRTGEAMGLDRGDVDLAGAVLTIRNSKFGKSRLVPLHHSTVEHLAAYQVRRDELCSRPTTPAFFVSSYGTRLNYVSTSKAFARVLKTAGVTVPAGVAKPRLYDLRHTFAVTTMIRWYADGVDVAHLLPSLSTYLGHISPATPCICTPARS